MSEQTYPNEANPEDLDSLCSRLSELATGLRSSEDWPAEQLKLCAEAGVFRWFMPPEWGGWDWSEAEITEGYLKLSAACLTTTFVITQRTGACRRLSHSTNESLKQKLLPALVEGDSFSTVGISHLTTSRRHLGKPALEAKPVAGGYLLNGLSPWVTGAPFAENIVVGAEIVIDSGEGQTSGQDAKQEQILVAVPADREGVNCPPTPELIGLSASRTGRVEFDNVFVEEELIVAGPVAEVMKQGPGASTGGLQTSTLAIGLARAAIDFIGHESKARTDLAVIQDALNADWQTLRQLLVDLSLGVETESRQALRAGANSLVVRATQAALTAAKGSGYVVGHPAGRWCQEALFFLVWSCPQEVLSANLCEFAGIADG